MIKLNRKRVFSIIGVIGIFVLIMQIQQNSHQSNQDGDVSFFKKYTLTKQKGIKYVDRDVRHECGHSKVIQNEKKLNQPEQAFDDSLYGKDDISHLLPVEQSYNNIRIHLDFSNIANLSQNTQDYIKAKVFPAVVSYIEAIVKVQRQKIPLKVDPFYKGKTCGQGKVIIPEDHFTNGVSDADLIFYIQSHKEDTNLLAYSSFCPQGNGFGLPNGRPTVAYMSYNLNQLEKDTNSQDTMVLAKWIYMTTHELIHSLVFSPNYFNRYLLERNPVQLIDGKPYVTAPSVLQVAKEYYGCSSVTKIPLEDEGGSTTFGFHWERKAFGNEIMTGSFLYDSILSKFTAAMFKASGWYQIVDSLVADLTWGIGEKCEFLNDECPKNTKEFCTISGKRCNFDYIGQGTCSNNDILANKCSYFQPSKTQHCTFPDEKSKNTFIELGGSWGPKARCFDADFSSIKEGEDITSLCFESHCDFSSINPTIIFKVFGQEYICTDQTREVEIPGKGKVTCPDIVRFCQSIAACPYSCSGKGICRLGKCTCFKGFTGEDCTQSE